MPKMVVVESMKANKMQILKNAEKNGSKTAVAVLAIRPGRPWPKTGRPSAKNGGSRVNESK